jgi:hypothetical protein
MAEIRYESTHRDSRRVPSFRHPMLGEPSRALSRSANGVGERTSEKLNVNSTTLRARAADLQSCASPRRSEGVGENSTDVAEKARSRGCWDKNPKLASWVEAHNESGGLLVHWSTGPPSEGVLTKPIDGGVSSTCPTSGIRNFSLFCSRNLLKTPQLTIRTPLSVAIMGYTDVDKLAVNTIRLLSVSSLPRNQFRHVAPPRPAQSLLSHLQASNCAPKC